MLGILAAIETGLELRFIEAEFFCERSKILKWKASTTSCCSLKDGIGVLPECIVTSQFIRALRCLFFLLGIGMKGEREMTIHPDHVILIGVHDLLHRWMVPLAEWTLKIRILDDGDSRLAQIATDVIGFCIDDGQIVCRCWFRWWLRSGCSRRGRNLCY